MCFWKPEQRSSFLSDEDDTLPDIPPDFPSPTVSPRESTTTSARESVSQKKKKARESAAPKKAKKAKNPAPRRQAVAAADDDYPVNARESATVDANLEDNYLPDLPSDVEEESPIRVDDYVAELPSDVSINDEDGESELTPLDAGQVVQISADIVKRDESAKRKGPLMSSTPEEEEQDTSLCLHIDEDDDDEEVVSGCASVMKSFALDPLQQLAEVASNQQPVQPFRQVTTS